MGLLDGVKILLELSECIGSTTEETMKNVRLVNRHWSQWATSAITRLRSPTGRVMGELVQVITQKFCNLDSLLLDRMRLVTDDVMRIVSTIPGLTCVDLSNTDPL